ncbi:SDR family NAD(P)-dependent oxidoreductase [Streptomyces sp. NPDC000594]|uniref:SDR family NAD(P)-dependent oxidoreductase n=1 Tax=Streptomyces sp. NPDC000594 TaxID=3154261 RepID=UPI00332923FF
MKPLLGLGDLDLTDLPEDNDALITHARSPQAPGPVAIIGMSGRAGEAENLDEFWAMVLRGGEGRSPLSPERRADVAAYLAARGVTAPVAEERYIGGTRMRSVAEFDYRFFSLSPQEAKTIDPNQRIFLETAWAALEDAGVLNQEIHGERVGVYAGLSGDFGDDYRTVIQAVAPEAPEIAVAGNVKSITGSRIAYLLDLKGPSMVIDTACSSGLVAAYTAFRAIQRGECTMALVGAVNTDLVPVEADASGIGFKDIQDTSSPDGRTRTFDRKGEGTRPAEGCFVFVLKDLDRARRDGDPIHAVIMGGAVNQDGASNGITAPNSEAQADLIEAALNDAGVDAERISCIEAHGTATRLGDPIEISGIERAFSRQTSRKQFCAIGTVKTNIGHMDNASGLAGLAKLVMSLKRRTLPASLHFEEPNPNITFPQTPVYVNDTTVPWSDDPAETLYAGINSFGLSGTNCHLVVRGADPLPARERTRESAGESFLLPLSARDARGLHRLVERYRSFLADHEPDLADLTHTASAGRPHHPVRAAFTFGSRTELLALLDGFLAARGPVTDSASAPEAHPGPAGDEQADPASDLAYGELRLVPERTATSDPRALTEAERDGLSERAAALLAGGAADRAARRLLGSLYARGAEIDWRRAASPDARRIPLPTYPFERTRCWIEAPARPRRAGLTDGARLLRAWDRDISVSRLDPATMWELADHRIHGVSVLPGTGLVEMVVETAQRLGHGPELALRNIRFELPLAVADGEDAEAHVIVEPRGETSQVTIATRPADGPWVRNATAELVHGAVPAPPAPLDLAGIRRRMTRELRLDDAVDIANGLVIGERWTRSVVHGAADDDATEILYEHELPAAYREETGDYHLHPALLDALINAPNTLYDEERLYLPFSYGLLTVHGRLPAHVLTHFRKRPESIDGELYVFDVTVADTAGRTVLTVENYCIKSAAGLDLAGTGEFGHTEVYRRTSQPEAAAPGQGAVLLAGDFGDALEGLLQEVRTAGYDPVHIASAQDGAADERLGGDRRFAFGLLSARGTGTAGSLADRVTGPVDASLALLTLIAEQRPDFAAGLSVLTRHALAVTGDESAVDPGQAGVVGLMRIAALEYTGLGIRVLDGDEHTAPERIVAEARSTGRPPFLAYRAGQPYEPHLTKCAIPPAAAEGAGVPVTDGVTVISGGTGGLGTAVARDLARRGARRIVLLGSVSGDTPREPQLTAEWERLREELAGFEIVRLPLEDREAVEKTVAAIRERHGRISTVLHLAGRPGIGYLHTKSADTFRSVYRPKALGAVHLHEATLADELDHFIVFSSISGLDLAAGQADYTAANLVLDSLARYRVRAGLPALSIQWPAWRETGMAMRLNAVSEDDLFPPLGTDEAVGLLERLMAWEEHPVVLMPGRMRKPTAPARTEGDRRPGTPGGRAVVLYGLEDVGEVEQAIAEIWADTLDVPEIDAHDHFVDLGGNSLLISQMLKLYDDRYPGLMDVADLFRYTTIAAQVGCIKEKLGVEPAPVVTAPPVIGPPVIGPDDGDIDRLLDLAEQGVVLADESQRFI